jgi:hypothetical protein
MGHSLSGCRQRPCLSDISGTIALMGRGRFRPAPETARENTDRLGAGTSGDLRDREARHPQLKAGVAGKNAKHLSQTIKQVPQGEHNVFGSCQAALCRAPGSEREDADE